MNAPAEVSRVKTAAVTGFISEAMIKAGVPAPDAAKIAELMLEADLIGADAHGVFRLPQYVQRLKLGSTKARPNITVNKTAPATALVDGDNGMGHLVVARAAELAVEMARECGVAWVGCVHSNHAGAAGVYAALPLKSDMIGMYSAPILSPLPFRPARNRRWCWISPLRSCPTAPSRTTSFSASHCTTTG